jgi:hypothetical protein
MPFEFVISNIPWASAGDLRCPIHETAESTCASPTPSWARWLVRSQPSIPSPHAAPHFPKPSGTWWSPMPAPCSELRSRGQRCAMHRAVSRTGSAGAWLEPFVRRHLADAGRPGSSRADARDSHARSSPETSPRSGGLWKLPELWTRKRPRAHKLLGRRPTDAGVHSYHSPHLSRSSQTITRPPNRGRSNG